MLCKFNALMYFAGLVLSSNTIVKWKFPSAILPLALIIDFVATPKFCHPICERVCKTLPPGHCHQSVECFYQAPNTRKKKHSWSPEGLFATGRWKFSGWDPGHLLLNLTLSGFVGPLDLLCVQGSFGLELICGTVEANCSSCWDQSVIWHTKHHLSVGLWTRVKDKAFIKSFQWLYKRWFDVQFFLGWS